MQLRGRMTEVVRKGAHKHTVPVIDRMMEILAVLESRSDGVSITDLTEALKQPRTTIYRILNTLQHHEIVRRDEAGSYRLGPRLLQLAGQVSLGASRIDLASIAQPFLDRLAAELGEGCKLSVVDHQGLVVLAAAQGRREYALTVTPGQHIPIHVGASGKLLLAHLPEEQRARWLSRPLASFTSKTMTNAHRLQRELARIRRMGWSQDKGESAPSIHAVAAPISDRSGKIIAAVSVPFLAGSPAERVEEIRLAALNTANAISAALQK